MRNRMFLLAVLAIGLATPGRAVIIASPIPSSFTLLGAPVAPSDGIPIPDPALRVSLNPQPLPPFPDPGSGLNLNDPTTPVYDYPASAFEIEDFSFDVEQVLNIGSQSSGAGAGKVTFNPFQITKQTDTVSGKLILANAAGAVLETITINFAGLNTDTFAPSLPELLPCGGVLCAYEAFSFLGTAPDPMVSFSVMSGPANIAFSVVPEPSTWVMMGLGFAGLAYAGYRARRGAVSIA
jgi:Type VI secretion system effector, Hcp/PEP-CTERM motif